MAKTIMSFFEKYLIKDYLDAQTDDFEIAKIRLSLDFIISFLLLSCIVVPIFFIVKNSFAFSFNLFLPVPFVICIILLKYGKNYKLSSFIFSFSVYLMITANSVIANGSVSINVAIWYCVIILFSNLIISNKASVFFMILIFATVTGIVLLKIHEFQFFNTGYNEENSLIATPFILCFAFIVMYRLLSEYARLMREAINKIIATNKAKDDILRIVAHDLRNPIGAVRTICYLLQNDISMGTAQTNNSTIPENIDLIDNASDNAMNIIDDLTESAEIEERKSVLNIEIRELAPLLESIKKLYEAKARIKKISLKSSYTSKKIFVKIDRRKFSRAIENMISNAIKFTYKNGTVEINLTMQGENARISIIDNGIGIPKNMQNVMYDKFTDARRPGTDGEKTIGLGLSITKDIILRHSGKIWCKSSTDNGTTFYIEIPACERPEVIKQ